MAIDSLVTHSLLWDLLIMEDFFMPRLRHYDGFGAARFVTFCCFRQGEYLNDNGAKILLIKHIRKVRLKHKFKLLGYVIMPEHVHLVIFPPDTMKLGMVIGEIKSKMAREYFDLKMKYIEGKKVFWQKRCYDHNCRAIEEVREAIKYCHNNPVKRGIVREPGDYLWSSYNWYHGITNVPLEMNSVEF